MNLPGVLNSPVGLIAFGLIVGVFSGVLGLGGGSVMIPMMVLVLGMTQPQANGTSLAVMTLPVALPAVFEYYRKGNVKLGMAGWMALGVLCGSFFGAYLAGMLPKELLKLVFGFFLIYIAGYTIFGKEHLQRTTLLAGGLVGVAFALFMAARWHDAARENPTEEVRMANQISMTK